MSIREGLSVAGWNPDEMDDEMLARAYEWWTWDGEQCFSPDQSSMVFGVAVHNFTFRQFSSENRFVTDQRGHNAWIKGEASEFLLDEQLLLNTVVTKISQESATHPSVRIDTHDGGCIEAEHAICTFSLGVLQHDDVAFEPALPGWKQDAIARFQMGTYTKIFMQFPEVFWDADTEFHLYADPYGRGWYPIFQSLDKDGFFPGSRVLFVTVVNDEARRVERQPEDKTRAEIMDVLRSMFPDRDVPEPDAFLFPRWNEYAWARGSFSNWPPATSLETHQNLRANVHRLWFAGEHTSAGYFGYMQGAYFEGRDVGNRVAGLLRGGSGAGRACANRGDPEDACGDMMHYDVLHGSTYEDEYDVENGWTGTSIVTEESKKEVAAEGI
jgi:polyamine oxidase